MEFRNRLALWLMIGAMLFFSNEAPAAVTLDLDEIIVTATRIAQYDYKTTSNVTVIGKDEIEASGVQTIPEILESELGINIYDNSSMKTKKVDIRGFGDTAARNILVLVNDRKINPIDISGADLIQIPLEAVERIEIIRGAASVLYGDNAVGGVINIVTKQGKGKLSGKIGGLYGSYDTTAEDMELSGSLKDLSYYVYSRYYNTGGYRQNSEVLSKDFTARTGYKFSDHLKIDLNTAWHEDDYRMPGGLTLAEIEQYGRRGSTDINDFAKTKDRYVQLTLDAMPWPENLEWGHFLLDLSYRNRDAYAKFPDLSWATKSGIKTFGMTGKYIFDKKILGQDMNLVAGFDFYDIDNDIRGFEGNTDSLRISKKEFGGYLFSEFEILDHVYINGGTRYQKADYVFDQKQASPRYEKKEPSEQVSMTGLKYEYARGSNIFFNIQQTFRFLATDEWYASWKSSQPLNTDLKHQKGIQYEVGVKHNFQDKLTVGITPYWLAMKDEIYYNPSTYDNSNYDKTRRIGVEGDIKVDILKFWNIEKLDKLEFSTNYTYQDSQFRDGLYHKKTIPLVPHHQASSNLKVGFLKNFSLSFQGQYVGSRFIINDLSNSLPRIKPHYVLNTKLAFENNNLEIYANVNNITNKKYSTYAATSGFTTDYFPAPGTNFTIGMKYKF
ncbi:MAG: TonB-dependent receptor [Candidatus Omnitrophota bacterium]